jgi:hypothetical protein
VFGDAGLPQVERNSAALAKYIRNSRSVSINVRDIRRSAGIPQLKDTDAAEAACAALVDADWLKPRATRASDAPGRMRKDFVVNPAVLDAPRVELA